MSSLCPHAAFRSRSSMRRAGHPAFSRSAVVSAATAFSIRVRWLIVGVGEALANRDDHRPAADVPCHGG